MRLILKTCLLKRKKAKKNALKAINHLIRLRWFIMNKLIVFFKKQADLRDIEFYKVLDLPLLN